MDSLKSIEQASKNLLSKGVEEDTPSGSTPRKRKWQYADDWNLTASRHELLRSRSENEAVEPRESKVVHSRPADIENEMQPTETLHISNKVEGIKEPIILEPLVDSRRRNVTRTTRRAR